MSHPIAMPAPAGATFPSSPFPPDKLERIPDGFGQMLDELESAGIIHPTSHDQGAIRTASARSGEPEAGPVPHRL